ncbi:pilus assembly protein TadG-related protein [Phyllobacterium endophyticum]|uniref:Putative Flp pilus-assembly TadG-like N-terminal domain-containing protein n=1 Tax=Phyllobacterium endophyticum TaxID=1149773 RepID=A0A2P7AUX2_9HYPH|nr:pilus assembly protein TadG-related protein [Phyllobacterium endophyticum]MBB3234497.1 hypothetical protein [Phyllobacterium endophyticum]PSH57991.1 hypothetical protein CU100_09980 [Phyllobacterium endophyticum]TYR38659.1 hypothetical protein FY050_21950 [Phyllobacterium endophyticum]
MRRWRFRHIQRLKAFLQRFAEEDGNVAIIFALCLPLVIGGAGLGVETSYWFYSDLKLQAAADASAYAGALEKASGSGTPAIVAAATSSATSNYFETSTGEIEVFTPPSTGPNTTKRAVEVILHQRLGRFFTSIYSQTPVLTQARAVALIAEASKACILALDPSASNAALFSGSSDVKLKGCSVIANSIDPNAIKVQGSAKLEVDCLISAGGVDTGNGAVKTVCAAPITKASIASDPFAGIAAPQASATCQNAKANSLKPGTYCSGLALSGNVSLSPGVYVIKGGDFKINANARVQGDGVTIYLAEGSRVSMNGNATVQLSAPTSGVYSGILFFGDRSSVGGSNTFNGTADSLLTGALYFAVQQVRYLGNFSGEGGCSQVVAGTIEWTGNTGINQDCSSLGMRDIPAAQSIQLVE